ncbi:peptide MFS transporter [Streptomyces sp. AK010]|uniref:peptide MFS transporter n=1 Tax=Streptomyces sp. AK010 TaxID=2723074 RepID=UPI0016092A48|nr:oligopeptide:H+ symporter [Streptomyces sp. AK010]MBB6418552.1 POT family proton-dependent oligopeptide transporter [Streptomyces sp. AK010]
MDTSLTPRESPPATAGSAPPRAADRGPGFGTLLAVDLWERFSFYGLAAILVLYLTASEARGGMGMAPQSATVIFAAYMSLSFMAGLPGGWLADRVLGARRAVLLGGALITCGHAVLAVPVTGTLYAGLLLVVGGTGLVKPAMAAMVAGVSGDGEGRREAAFSLFYMCIQVSALIAPVVTGLLAERVAWHLGFAAAAVGMAAGLIQFALGLRRYGDVGARPPRPVPRPEALAMLRRAAWATGAVGALVVVPVSCGLLPLPVLLAVLGLTTITLPFWYLRSLRRAHAPGTAHRRRLTGFTALMAASAAFWMIFAQSGSVLSLFAERHTDRDLLGFEVPASWFQSVHPLFVLLVAPLFARLWVRAPRLDVPVKFAGALIAAGAGFLLMAVAATLAEHGPVGPYWLLLVYLLYSCGEIALAPAGLALAAAVAPPGSTSRLLAVNGLFGAVGVVVGGQLFRLTSVLSPAVYFLLLGGLVLGVGTTVALGTPRLRALLAGNGT